MNNSNYRVKGLMKQALTIQTLLVSQLGQEEWKEQVFDTQEEADSFYLKEMQQLASKNKRMYVEVL